VALARRLKVWKFPGESGSPQSPVTSNVSSVPGSVTVPVSVVKPFSSTGVAERLESSGTTLSTRTVVLCLSWLMFALSNCQLTMSWFPHAPPVAAVRPTNAGPPPRIVGMSIGKLSVGASGRTFVPLTRTWSVVPA